MELKKTALFERHERSGGKMVEFAGWLMPVRYGKGIIHEHRAVRTGIGLFDVSHMGEIRVRGAGAGHFVDRMCTNVAPREAGAITYTPLCYPDGGIVDDVTVYCVGEDDYVFVVNAANTRKDYDWLAEHASGGVAVEDESPATGQLAVQGPSAVPFVSDLLEPALVDLGRFKHRAVTFGGHRVMVSRTGYTGEDGFELYTSPEGARKLWDALTGGDSAAACEPIGLGARDTLRFEASYRLYGNDIDETTDPLEAGLGWTVKFSKDDFIGREVLAKRKERGPSRKFVGLRLLEKRIARKGNVLRYGGEEVGRVTSGAFAPYLEQSLAMGYLRKDSAGLGTRIEVDVRGRGVEAEVVKIPFLTGKGKGAAGGAKARRP